MTVTDGGSELPLAALRVLDLCRGPGSSAARILADLGADVIVVESRRDPEPTGGSGEIQRAVRHANKRSIVLDLSAGSDDLDTFWELAAGCDIVFEDSAPGDTENPVTARTLRHRLPQVVTVAVTAFGQSGPYRDWIGSEAVYVALSGELSRSGLPGREPLLPPARIATESAAAQAAWSALLAYAARLETGNGQLVDFSLLEGIAQTLDPGWGMAGSASGGRPAAAEPRGRPDSRVRYPIFPCADGYVRLCILSPRQWQGMFAWLGKPEELADPGWHRWGSGSPRPIAFTRRSSVCSPTAPVIRSSRKHASTAWLPRRCSRRRRSSLSSSSAAARPSSKSLWENGKRWWPMVSSRSTVPGQVSGGPHQRPTSTATTFSPSYPAARPTHRPPARLMWVDSR
ncbi:coA-transferase III family protein [Mycobacterium avium subsp. avium 2285 (R)]|nr:coA-transferase III family protein [Mycobacterium avium subsp. avium 2285 (R)]